MNSEIRSQIIQSTIEKASEDPLDKILENQIREMTDLQEDKIFELHADILDEMEGYGPLAKYLKDISVTEILVDSFNEIFIERESRLQKVESHFTNSASLNRFVTRILREIDRVADQRHPLVDGNLSDGTRVHISLPPVTARPVISIRKHNISDWTLTMLCQAGVMNSKILTRLINEVEKKSNILICGATSSGKTTLLRALLNEVPPHERIITVEDTSELALKRSNTVSLLTRISLENLFPAITLNDLLKNALRMRPDRLIVGEIRSDEALVFLDAVSTGHTGSMSSIHGSSAVQALSRLEHLVSRGAPQWATASIRKLIYESIDLIVNVERKNGGRQIAEIVELAGLESFGFLLEPWVLA